MPGFLDYLAQEYEKGKKDLARQKTLASQLLNKEKVTPIPVEPSEEAPFFSKRNAAKMIGRGAVNMAPSVTSDLAGAGVGALGGPIGSAVGSAVAGGSASAAQAYLDAYNEALLAGKSEEEAAAYAKDTAKISGSVDAVLSAVPFFGKAAGAGVKGIAKSLGKQSGVQSLGAAGETAARNALAKEADVDPERELGEGVLEAGMTGAAVSLPLQAAGIVSKSFKGDVGKLPHPEKVAKELVPDLNQEMLNKAKQLALAPPKAQESWWSWSKPSLDSVKAFSRKIQDGVFDDFTGIRKLTPGRESENKAYRMARYSRHLDGIYNAALEQGVPVWNHAEGIVEIKPETQGLMKILSPVLQGDEMKRNFEMYAYARRVKSQDLIAKGKEFNLTPEMVDNAHKLEQVHPEFKEIFDRIQEYKKSVLDIAEETGVIDPEKRKVWEQDDHIPFYRELALEDDAAIKNPSRGDEPGKKLTGQSYKVHELTGGKKQYAIFDDEGAYVGRQSHPTTKEGWTAVPAGDAARDITGNILKNTSDLLQRSVRNAAAQETITQALEGGIAQRVTHDQAHPRGKVRDDVVKVKEGGKDVLYKINDPLLYSALQATGAPPRAMMDNPWGNGIRRWAKIVSGSIVATPKTMLAIAQKDFIQSKLLGKDPGIGLRQSIANVRDAYQHVFTDKKDPRALAMMAMGASDMSSTRGHADTLKSIHHDLKQHNALVLSAKNVGNHYMNLGRAAELASRLNRYDAAKKAGLSKAASGFEALDYMDYRMRGSSDLLALATQVTPFLSTHLASLHKVGRELAYKDGKLGRNRTFRAVGTLGLVSAGNAIMNLRNPDEDDPNDYRALPDYIKFGNMCIDLKKYGISDEVRQATGLPRHLLIPKPWELGQLAMGVPEQLMRYLMDDADGMEQLKYISDTLTGTFSMDPVFGHPLVKTGMEHMFGKTSFTGQSIVPRRYEDMPQEVKTPYQMEHLFTGILGPLYSLPFLILNDTLIDKEASGAIGKVFDIRRINRLNEPLERTRYENEFYDLLRESRQAYNMMRAVDKGEFGKTDDDVARLDDQYSLLEQDFKRLKKDKKTVDQDSQELKKLKAEQGYFRSRNKGEIDSLQNSKNLLLKQIVEAAKRNKSYDAQL